MTITAVFSNGHRDTYKGHRDVKAAWMICDRKTGRVLNSGHSLDRTRAQKTAEGNVAHAVRIDGRGAIHTPRSAMHASPGWVAHTRAILAGLGIEPGQSHHAVLRQAKAHNAELNAAKRALVQIEVIDL